MITENHKGYPKIHKGKYDLQIHRNVSGGIRNEGKNVNYKFRIKAKCPFELISELRDEKHEMGKLPLKFVCVSIGQD